MGLLKAMRRRTDRQTDAQMDGDRKTDRAEAGTNTDWTPRLSRDKSAAL